MKARTISYSMPATVKSEYQDDPRNALAQAMIKQDSSYEPVSSPIGGLARALSAVVGGYTANKLNEEYQGKTDDYRNDLANALTKANTGIPSWTNPDTGQEAIPAVKPGIDSLIAALSNAKSPPLQEMGANAAITKATREPSVSDFGKIIAERDSLPPGDPRRSLYDAHIEKMNTATNMFGQPIAVFNKSTGQLEFTNKPDALKDPNLLPPDAAPKPAQSKDFELQSSAFAEQMVNSNSILDKMEASQGFDPTNYRDNLSQKVPLVGNSLVDPKFQQYRQAQEAWVRAKLRKESGALIGDDEMNQEIKTFFPQPGDTPETIAQKQKARLIATNSMIKSAGPAWGGQAQTPPQPANNETGNTGLSPLPQPSNQKVVPQEAISFLKANAKDPTIAAAFQEKYGVPATQYLGK